LSCSTQEVFTQDCHSERSEECVFCLLEARDSKLEADFMESVFGRYRNLVVLVGVLFAQILGLAVQVRRTRDSEPTRLIRIWAVGAVTPLEKTLSWVQTSSGGIWHNYFYLRGVRAENRELKREIEQMRLDQARITQDADQAHRLQALLGFKEQFISQTTAAQVIGGTGSELSRSVYIDKGERDGIKPDMAVLTRDGVVGKVLHVYRSTSLVLLIDDQTSGVGSILEKSRLQGILRGTSSGTVVLEKVMSDETVPVGEQVLTSGGDGIFPKGLTVGTVTKVSTGSDLFLNIHVRPAADLNRLEEVLVVTKVDEKQTEPAEGTPVRAADILAERLPSVPPKPDAAVGQNSAGKNPANSNSPSAPKMASPNLPSAPGTPSVQSKPKPQTKSPTEVSGGAAPGKTPPAKVNSIGTDAAGRLSVTSAPSGTANPRSAVMKKDAGAVATSIEGSTSTGSAANKTSTANTPTAGAPGSVATKKPAKAANPDAVVVPPKSQSASEGTPQ
jgi:rod shape-determining protein MreC